MRRFCGRQRHNLRGRGRRGPAGVPDFELHRTSGKAKSGLVALRTLVAVAQRDVRGPSLSAASRWSARNSSRGERAPPSACRLMTPISSSRCCAGEGIMSPKPYASTGRCCSAPLSRAASPGLASWLPRYGRFSCTPAELRSGSPPHGRRRRPRSEPAGPEEPGRRASQSYPL